MEEAHALKHEARLPGQREIPPYQRMADLIRGRIMDGVYKAGGRIPSETALAKSSGLAPLTVRKALRILVDEGLLERFTGKGTYVTELSYRKALFSIEGLDERIHSSDMVTRIIAADVRRASEDMALKLGVKPGDPLWYIKRSIRAGGGKPFLIQEGFVILDPYRPVVEAELATTYLTGLFSGGGQGLVKTAKMKVRPLSLGAENAQILQQEEGLAGFQMEYIFYDAAGAALAAGSFIAPEETFSLTSTLGLPLNGKGR
jgi:DNA-binding GntR family transcriptional regulator